jgi:hypothetical protein
MWSIADIARAIQVALLREADRLETEQAVYGLDTRNEVSLQALLAQGLENAGFGVHREERYPEYRNSRKASEGQRCDLVLTQNGRPLARPEDLPTFFDPPDPVALDEAFWLEVKIAAQFRTGGPNRRYSSLFAAIRRDIAKLSAHKGIRHGALLILLFAHDQLIADHDLGVWRSQCSEHGFQIGDPSLGLVPVGDRLGNTMCRVGLYPVCRVENGLPAVIPPGDDKSRFDRAP